MLKRSMEGGIGLLASIIDTSIRWKMHMLWQKVCILDLYICPQSCQRNGTISHTIGRISSNSLIHLLIKVLVDCVVNRFCLKDHQLEGLRRKSKENLIELKHSVHGFKYLTFCFFGTEVHGLCSQCHKSAQDLCQLSLLFTLVLCGWNRSGTIQWY